MYYYTEYSLRNITNNNVIPFTPNLKYKKTVNEKYIN